MDTVALINPLSSGPYIARAFQENGVGTIHVYEPKWSEAIAHDPLATHVLVHERMDETVAALRRLGPLAVVAGSEDGVILVDQFAAELGHAHNDLSKATARRDKQQMLETVAAAGIEVGWSHLVLNEAELLARIGEVADFPVVVKPRDSAGGDGLQICYTPQQALAAFRAADNRLNLMRDITVGAVIQEYLAGDQYMVNTVSIGGRHLLTDYYQQRIDRISDREVSRHLKSRRTLRDIDHEIIEYALRCLDALGLSEGAGHTEIRLTADGPRLIEVNSRLMGPIMEADPYFVAFGYSPQHLLAESYLRPDDFRKRFELPYQPARHLARSYIRAKAAGVIKGISNIDLLRTLPAFHSAYRIPSPGTVLADPHLTTGQTGIAYFVHEDEETLDAALSRLHNLEDAGVFYEVA